MIKEELFKQLEDFLSEQNKIKDGGWAEVKENDVNTLYSIMEGILELKYERDYDGDLPIDWNFIDRTKYYHPFLHYGHVKYLHKSGTLGEYMERLRDAETNLATAQDQMTTVIRYISTLISQDEKLKNLVVNKRSD